MSGPARYVGRFAPSPTGPLHFGSLVAAVGSWLDARRQGGRWLLRFDDLDTPRNVPGSEAAITAELVRLGLEWDGPVMHQRHDTRPYLDAVARLRAAGRAFGCGCSRRDLVEGVYPGTCRGGLPRGTTERSVRLRVDDRPVEFEDLVQGPWQQRLERETGDFVILRADGIVAYHLATVVDDAAAGVTQVVRGADLLDSTPRQIALQQALSLPRPRYAHLPVAVNAIGQKLSKQTHAPDTAGEPAGVLWHRVLSFLGHAPPGTLATGPVQALQDWALAHWDPRRAPRRQGPGVDAPPARAAGTGAG